MSKKKKSVSTTIQKSSKLIKAKSFSEQLKEEFRNKRIPKVFLYNYHTIAFQYFHAKIKHLLSGPSKYRRTYWAGLLDGVYKGQTAQNMLADYKEYLEHELKKIIEKYSVVYWLHVSRRISPNTIGDDHRTETIIVCRNIIVAAIQKYGQLTNCGNIGLSSDLKADEVFSGLFLKSEFSDELRNYGNAPEQLVLKKFDENSLLEYYSLEDLAFELWLTGAKNRVIAKGANLIVDKQTVQILFDDRSKELSGLIENFDSRETAMVASATGTVFTSTEIKDSGIILITQIFTKRTKEIFSDPIVDLLGIQFLKGHFPNFQIIPFDIKTFWNTHKEFGKKFLKKWNVKLEYIFAIICDIGLSLIKDVIDKDIVAGNNMLLRSYRLYKKNEFNNAVEMNWHVTMKYLGLELVFEKDEFDKAFDFLSLNEANKNQIFVDSFGPLRIFTPGYKEDDIIIDISIIGDVLYNLFYGLSLTDHGSKGELLENALKKEISFLPTAESKGLDGTAKQVDFSVARGDILILAECKAVARSFGIFGGQSTALEHRLRNVIDKGLNDVDEKVQWFLNHPKGTNFDITKFKFILGVAVSPYPEFIHSREEKYWLNDDLPRVLTIQEFERLIDSDLVNVITKNLIPIS